MSNRPWPPLTLALAGIVVALAAWLVVELQRDPLRERAAVLAAPDAETGAGAPLPTLDAIRFDAISERPLFTSTRRPPQAPEAAQPQPAARPRAAPPNWRLTGVAITGELRAAVIQDLHSRRSFSLEEGGSADGWTLVEVEAHQVRIENDGQQELLPLRPY